MSVHENSSEFAPLLVKHYSVKTPHVLNPFFKINADGSLLYTDIHPVR